MKQLLVFLFAMTMTVISAHADDADKTSNERDLVLRMLEQQYPPPYVASSVQVVPIGKNTRIVSAAKPNDVTPSSGGSLWILDQNGNLSHFSKTNFINAMKHEYPNAVSAEDRIKIATYFTRYNSFYTSARIISSITEIPGHQDNPLPIDYQSVIRTPWSYETTDPMTVRTSIFVCYSYNQTGGSVDRYEFYFTEGYLVEIQMTNLGTHVGSYEMVR